MADPAVTCPILVLLRPRIRALVFHRVTMSPELLGDHCRATSYEVGSPRHLGEVHRADGDPAAAREAWRRALSLLDDADHETAEAIRPGLRDLDAL
jgi:hypothetical protein